MRFSDGGDGAVDKTHAFGVRVRIHCETINVSLSKTHNPQLLQRRATSDIYSNCKSLWIKASAK